MHRYQIPVVLVTQHAVLRPKQQLCVFLMFVETVWNQLFERLALCARARKPHIQLVSFESTCNDITDGLIFTMLRRHWYFWPSRATCSDSWEVGETRSDQCVFIFIFYSFTVLGTTEAEREMAEGIPSIPTAYRSSATRREKCVKELKTTRAR